MTLKQLVERVGVPVQMLDFELASPCGSCKFMGGTEVQPCKSPDKYCVPIVKINIAGK